jgi:protein O-GlcNAc transferase
LVVGSQSDFAARAVELGTDHGKRLALRGALEGARLSCPLFDTARWVRDLEKVYFKMWDIHVQEGAPRTFEVA